MPSVTATIALPGSPTLLSNDDRFVYVAHSDEKAGFGVSAIDTATNQIAAYMPTVGAPVAMSMGISNLYLASLSMNQWVSVMSIDVIGGTTRRITEFPGTVLDAVTFGREVEELVFATSIDANVEEPDIPVSNVPHRQALAVENTPEGPSVWAATTEGQIFHVPEGGRPVYNVGPNLIKMAIDSDRALWFSQQWGDTEDGTVQLAIGRVNHYDDVPDTRTWSEFGPGTFAVDDAYVWVLRGGNVDLGVPGTVTQLIRTAGPGVEASSTTVGMGPIDIVSTGSDVWVANFADQSLSRIGV